MHYPRNILVTLIAASSLLTPLQAQEEELVQDTYTDPETGIEFETWTAVPDSEGRGAFTFGMALPEDAATNDATEYIGLLRCQSYAADRTGWCGITHSSSMLNALLLIAWPYKDQVLTSFRLATDYFMPDPYTSSNATLTQIRSHVNESSFELLYRCENCFAWEASTGPVNVKTSEGMVMMGRAAALDGPEGEAGCPATLVYGFHNNGFGLLFGDVERLAKGGYGEWVGLATDSVLGDCEGKKCVS